MSFELRPYQKEAVEAVEKEWRDGNRRTLLISATGAGKTIMMGKIAKNAVEAGGRVLLLAHRGELLDQAADKFERAMGLPAAREQASSHSFGSVFPVTVGSVQTMMRKSRLDEFPKDYFTHVFVDEAHHAVADSYTRVLEHFPDAKVLGVTATADRSDKKGLSTVFDSIAFEYGIRDCIENGYLVPIEAQMIPLSIDLTKVRVRNGDFDEGDLGNALEPYLDAIADEMVKVCKGRRTAVFLPLVKIAKEFADILNSKGLRAVEIDGKSADRAQILEDYRNGKYDVVTNAMLLTEGWDDPETDCVVCLRPTKSRALYTQIIGRALRLAPGKTKATVLDFLWLSEKHNLCRPASLLGASEEIEKRVTDATKAGVPLNLFDTEQEVQNDMVEERKQSLADKLAENKGRKRKFIDPLDFATLVGDLDLQDYEESFRWEKEPPTQKQLDMLTRNGFDIAGMTKGRASKIISAIIDRNEGGFATAKQIMQLRRCGFTNPETWTREDAGEVMGILSSNGWKLPFYINPETYVPKSRRNADSLAS